MRHPLLVPVLALSLTAPVASGCGSLPAGPATSGGPPPGMTSMLFGSEAIAGLPPGAGVTAIASPTTGLAPDAKFAVWLDGVAAEALARGISQATLDAALVGIAPIPRVIELDRNQPESTTTFEEYSERILSRERVAKGRDLLARHRGLLSEVGSAFGVQPRFIVALWGIETNYGAFTGGFKVVPALATLAFDGRRSAYFREELMNALAIIDAGHIDPAQMFGSWAGAMGQSQFMPSSFIDYAVDYNGDGAKDIWNSLPDVFASAANYLASVGWRDDIGWGREVRLPPGFDHGLTGLETRKDLADWQRLGVRLADGGDLPAANSAVSIIQPDGPGDRAFAVTENFRATLRWNRSFYFATSVGQLSDRIAGPG
ncbi:MAG: lytic murein transglycosylase [Alphaproteobacteria bacterium]|nr:lytic murein transglycosylase [Alphaproteobacteria bacterium]